MALELEQRVLRVEGHLDGILLLQQHRLQQVCGFLRQDERRRDLILVLRLVLHQLVGVRTDEGQRIRRQVDVDTVHHRTQLVVRRGEDRLVDAVHQRVDIHLQLLPLGAQLRNGRVAHRTRPGDRERAALPVDLDLPVLVVDVDRQRKLRELLQRVEHQFGRSGDRALALDALDVDLADERRFEVRRRNFQGIAVELHEEVIQNGQRVFITDHLAGRRQKRQQRRT